MSTIAGEDQYSFVGSPIGNLNLWNQISDLQINPNGTQIIFSDSSTNKIRKIDFSTGLCSILINPLSIQWNKNNNEIILFSYLDSISTIAGSGNAGSQNGNVLRASFYRPSSIAIDWINSPDIIYVVDFYNKCIRKINQTSSFVSTFAGICSFSGYQNGPLLSALFSNPKSIRYLSSSSGTNLLAADSGNNVIRMIDISQGIYLEKRLIKINFIKIKNLLFSLRIGFNFSWKWICWISGWTFISCPTFPPFWYVWWWIWKCLCCWYK